MNPLYQDAGIRIRELRNLNKYTTEELADKIGISKRYLYNIEHGKQGFSAETLLRFSEVLDVRCDYIMKGTDESACGKEIAEVIGLFDESQKMTLTKVLRGIYELGYIEQKDKNLE